MRPVCLLDRTKNLHQSDGVHLISDSLDKNMPHYTLMGQVCHDSIGVYMERGRDYGILASPVQDRGSGERSEPIGALVAVEVFA